MEPQLIDLAKQTVAELLEHIGIEATLSESLRSDDDRELLVINIKVQNPSLLIGQQGVNLQALQHISRLLFRRKTTEHLNFILDVNEYKTKRVEYLKSLATDIAQRVTESGTFEVMRPMSSYERRIVHMELMTRQGITAESLGVEPNRRIVVKAAQEEKSLEEIAKEISSIDHSLEEEAPEEAPHEVAHSE